MSLSEFTNTPAKGRRHAFQRRQRALPDPCPQRVRPRDRRSRRIRGWRLEIGEPGAGIVLDQRGDRLARRAGEPGAEPGGADRVGLGKCGVPARLEPVLREADGQRQREGHEPQHAGDQCGHTRGLVGGRRPSRKTPAADLEPELEGHRQEHEHEQSESADPEVYDVLQKAHDHRRDPSGMGGVRSTLGRMPYLASPTGF